MGGSGTILHDEGGPLAEPGTKKCLHVEYTLYYYDHELFC